MKFNLTEPVKIRKKITDFVTKSGKLRKDFLPASYCDTSFLLDYWLSNKLTPSSFISDEEDHYKIIREKIRKKDKLSQDPLVSFTLTLFENICSYTRENLFGIIPVDFANITIRTPRDFNKLIVFPAYQIGVADILHLVSAKRLGCEYFITFDDDFKRAKKDIERFFNLKILTSPQEILKKI